MNLASKRWPHYRPNVDTLDVTISREAAKGIGLSVEIIRFAQNDRIAYKVKP
jgi:hypothetical protein